MYGTSRPQLKKDEEKPLVLAQQAAPQTPNEYAAGVADRAVKAGVRRPATAQPASRELQVGVKTPEKSGWSNAADGLAGGAKALVGASLVPHAAAADAVRNAAAMVAGGDPDTLDGGSAKYRDKAIGTFNDGLSQASGAAQNIQADMRDALGVKPRQPQAQADEAGAVSPAIAPSAATPTAEGLGARRESRPVSEAGNTWQGTGIGVGRAGGEIAMRTGADGAPEFTNENATPGATTGAAATQEGFGTRRPAAASVGDGVGTFTQLEPGTSQLALERFGRANEIRAGARRPAELGDNGGKLTVVRDSSRTPTLQERRLARLEAQLAQTEALQGRTANEANEVAVRIAGEQQRMGTEQLNQQRLGQQIEEGEVAAVDRQRMAQLRATIADPAASEEERNAARQAYNVLATQAKDRYIAQDVVLGQGKNGPVIGRQVIDVTTGQPVVAGGAEAGQGLPQGVTVERAMQEAQAAIAAGVPRDAVNERLRLWGINPL